MLSAPPSSAVPAREHRSLRDRLSSEQGFTLIELMVVILIVGILAGIAIVAFMTERTRGEDAAAKADARNTMTHVEACFTQSQDYTKCTTLQELGTGLGITMGTGRGAVAVTSDGATGYRVTATSRNGSTFAIVKQPGTWQVRRECAPASTSAHGGCLSDGSW